MLTRPSWLWKNKEEKEGTLLSESALRLTTAVNGFAQGTGELEAIVFGSEPNAKRAPTTRQQQIIALVARGLKNQEVARRIGTTEHVVKNYLRVIYDQLGFSNRVELALWFEARKAEAHGKERKSTGESTGMNQG